VRVSDHGIGSAARQRELHQVTVTQLSRVANNGSVLAGDDSVAALEHQLRVERAQMCGQSCEIGAVPLVGTQIGSDQAPGQPLMMRLKRADIRGSCREPARDTAHAKGPLIEVMGRATREPDGKVRKMTLLVVHALAGMRDAPPEIVHALHVALEMACERTPRALVHRTQVAPELDAIGRRKLCRAGRRRRTRVSDEVGDGEVGLVTHAANDGHRTRRQRPRHDLFVERPQIFDAAAAPTQNQQVALAAR
jgi:hypothetical protein